MALTVCYRSSYAIIVYLFSVTVLMNATAKLFGVRINCRRRRDGNEYISLIGDFWVKFWWMCNFDLRRLQRSSRVDCTICQHTLTECRDRATCMTLWSNAHAHHPAPTATYLTIVMRPWRRKDVLAAKINNSQLIIWPGQSLRVSWSFAGARRLDDCCCCCWGYGSCFEVINCRSTNKRH